MSAKELNLGLRSGIVGLRTQASDDEGKNVKHRLRVSLNSVVEIVQTEILTRNDSNEWTKKTSGDNEVIQTAIAFTPLAILSTWGIK